MESVECGVGSEHQQFDADGETAGIRLEAGAFPPEETVAAINEPVDESRSFKNAAELFSALDKGC